MNRDKSLLHHMLEDAVGGFILALWVAAWLCMFAFAYLTIADWRTPDQIQPPAEITAVAA